MHIHGVSTAEADAWSSKGILRASWPLGGSRIDPQAQRLAISRIVASCPPRDPQRSLRARVSALDKIKASTTKNSPSTRNAMLFPDRRVSAYP